MQISTTKPMKRSFIAQLTMLTISRTVINTGVRMIYPLLPVFVRQSAPSAGTTEPPIPQPEPELTEGSHLGYAVQWFSFALILVMMYSAFVWQESKQKLEEQ